MNLMCPFLYSWKNEEATECAIVLASQGWCEFKIRLKCLIALNSRCKLALRISSKNDEYKNRDK